MVGYDIWAELVAILEDWEDAQEIKQLRVLKEEAIPWGQAKEELNGKRIAEGKPVSCAATVH